MKVRVFTFIGGGVVTIFFGIMAWNLSCDHTREIFAFETGQIKETVFERIQASDAVAKSMQAFFHASLTVNAHEFKVYSEELIARYPFIVSVTYYPRIPASERQAFENEQVLFGIRGFYIFEYADDLSKIPARERPVYFPALYREPFMAEGAILLGYDILSHTDLPSTIDQAITTGSAIPSPLHSLAASQEIYCLFIATYEGKGLPATPEMRQNKVNGLLSFAIRPSSLFKDLNPEKNFVVCFSNQSFLSEDEQSGVLFEQPGTTQGFWTRLFSLPLTETFLLQASSQSFELTISRRIPFQELELWSVGFAVLVGIAGSWSVFLILQARANLKQELHTRRKAEQLLQQLNQELEQRVQDRTANLEAVNQELERFAYVVSHDLKAPLRGIAHLVDWLTKDYAHNLDANGQEMFALLLSRVKRLNSLIDGILQYSRVGRTDEEKELVNLGELVPAVIDNLNVPEHIRITIVDELPTVSCNTTRMFQVFQNLLGNAMKFLDKPQEEIRIGCQSQEAFWVLSVADNGSGIGERHQKRIFQLFQTVTSQKDPTSTGIGLALVKRIVELHGGRIWVESTVGEGSTFWFTLPKA